MAYNENKTIAKLRALYILSVIGIFLFALGMVNYGGGAPYPTIWLISGVVGILMLFTGVLLPEFMEETQEVTCDSGKMAEIDAIGFTMVIAGGIIGLIFSVVLGLTIFGAGALSWFFHPGAEIREKKITVTLTAS